MGAGIVIAAIVIIALLAALVWWVASMYNEQSDTLRKQNVLAEQYGCTPISVTAMGFWQVYECPPGTPDLLGDRR